MGIFKKAKGTKEKRHTINKMRTAHELLNIYTTVKQKFEMFSAHNHKQHGNKKILKKQKRKLVYAGI